MSRPSLCDGCCNSVLCRRHDLLCGPARGDEMDPDDMDAEGGDEQPLAEPGEGA